MAVDSLAERMSALNFARFRRVLPRPNGSVSTRDRVHLLGRYSGIIPTEFFGVGMWLEWEAHIPGLVTEKAFLPGVSVLTTLPGEDEPTRVF